ncbi:adenosine deaminase [Paraneptunicella aestuarii]|uniref:adenosine deaminase n=1 Tax=Paraneptunicella aestuarii TaxID=2831148 RepID=UPI001E3F4CB8|nr:adenosine deaminase [Paraneptunicella aestuarii]UAA40696.1 adenosine deaminase [Paraneptunicella aestuarii]
MDELIDQIPKAELHLHIEGSLEPELMMQLAHKHSVSLPYNSIEEVEQAYNFENLQSFLDLYYLGASVLRDEDDFYQLMWQYLCHCKEDNIVHAEIMFDPQTHTDRGIGFDVFMPGFKRALDKAKQKWGITHRLIMCFLRHLPEQSALETLEAATPYLDMITAVGLDSSEVGNPPENFTKAFAKAKELGLLRVAHAGEEGPPEYIWGALNSLDVQRIDHGVRCIEDEKLMQELIQKHIPLTVCPLSNIKLCVFDHMRDHNILELLGRGLLVTVNSDDPSYFGGYINDNFRSMNEHLGMSEQELKQLCINSFKGSFLDQASKDKWIQQIEQM